MNRAPPISNGLFGSAVDRPPRDLSGPDFQLIEGFLVAAEADLLMSELRSTAAWHIEYLQLFGRQVRSPRRVSWYGDPGVGYVYSGEHHSAKGWLPQLAALRDRLAVHLCADFNFVLLNHYRDHNDSMGWHSDNEPALGSQPLIASLSLGETRSFRVRAAKKIAGQRRISRRIELPHGSLLIMQRQSQSEFQHALPKSSKPCGERLNLTFRQVLELGLEAEPSSVQGL